MTPRLADCGHSRALSYCVPGTRPAIVSPTLTLADGQLSQFRVQRSVELDRGCKRYMPRGIARQATLDALWKNRPAILPSMLLCDFANLEREIRKLEDAGAQVLHLDVMDGHFVPNFTYGMTIVDAVRKCTSLVVDVHLMISSPERYVGQFVEAGADCLTFHVEAASDAVALVDRIKQLDVVAGVAINPSTPFTKIDAVAGFADLILVMSVEAGFGGQAFNPAAVERLRALRDRVRPDVLLEVDGGISAQTIQVCRDAGADLFVVGSAIFRHSNYRQAIQELAAACCQTNV
jgi:ribulose-phosphate 3-epimerase